MIITVHIIYCTEKTIDIFHRMSVFSFSFIYCRKCFGQIFKLNKIFSYSIVSVNVIVNPQMRETDPFIVSIDRIK